MSILNTQDSVLIVVDIQQRLAAAMPADIRQQVIDKTKLLLNAAKILAIPVVVTEQYPKGLGSTEAELTQQLTNDTSIIEKTSFSCTNSTEFCTEIDNKKRKQIILTGMESHICILQTALELHAQGFQVYVAEDAVSSRLQENKDNAMQRMRQAGVIITNVEAVIFEWLGDAKHPEFKVLAKLIA